MIQKEERSESENIIEKVNVTTEDVEVKDKNNENEENNEENSDLFICEDPVVVDAFNDMKAAIFANRTDIVRKILATGESIRELDNYDSDDEEECKKKMTDSYDNDECVDILFLLMRYNDNELGTLLHYATRTGSADIVRTLLAAGANATLKNKENKTPFMYCNNEYMKQAYVSSLMQAVSQSRLFRVQHFLSAGIDVNSHDGASSMNSLLHWAASYADIATVKLVIDRGGNVNALNAAGETPLHDAVVRNDADIVEELLKHGADKHIKACKGKLNGKSPVDVANQSGDEKTIQLLANQDNCDLDYSSVNASREDTSRENTMNNISMNYTSPISKLPINEKKPMLFPKLMQTDRLCQYLCPQPKMMKQFQGLFFVPPTDLDVLLTSVNDMKEMQDVVEMFLPKFQKIGISLHASSQSHNGYNVMKECHVQCIIRKHMSTYQDEYKLQITTDKVVILASSLSSFYYGFATFLQCVKLFKGKAVPLLQIIDWPSCHCRSVLLDFNGNDVPAMAFWYDTVDCMAMFKVNQIQINSQDISDKSSALFSARDFHKFQTYCNRRFIEVIPYIKFSENTQLYRNQNNNGHLSLNIEELDLLVNSFISQKYLHVDLKDISQALLVQQLHTYCLQRHLFLQLTNDNMEVRLESLPTLLDGCAYTLNVANLNDLNSDEFLKADLGLPIVLNYTNKAIDRLCPDITLFTTTLNEILRALPPTNFHGFVVNYSPTSRKLCNFTSCISSLVLATSMAWHTTHMDNDYIENFLNFLFYEDDQDVLGKTMIDLGTKLPLSNQISVFDHMIENSSLNGLQIKIETLHDICKCIKTHRNLLQKCQLKSPLATIVIEEIHQHLHLMYFLSRICYCLLNIDDASPHISRIPEVQKSDNSNKLMALIDEHEAFCKRHYKSTSTYGYISVKLLKDLLHELLPSNTPPLSPALRGVYNI